MEIIGSNNIELVMLQSYHPELTRQEIADRLRVKKNIVQHWFGRNGRCLPMPKVLFDKLLCSVGGVRMGRNGVPMPKELVERYRSMKK
jgi:hypothetical protein